LPVLPVAGVDSEESLCRVLGSLALLSLAPPLHHYTHSPTTHHSGLADQQLYWEFIHFIIAPWWNVNSPVIIPL